MGKPLTWLALNEQIDNQKTKLLLVAMAALAKEEKGKPNMVYAQRETLMKFTALSRSYFFSSIKTLKGKGLISQVISDYGHPSYILNLESQSGTNESQSGTDKSQSETPLYSNPNINPNTIIIEKSVFLESVKMGVAIPPVWAGEWYEECIRKGHFLHPNGKIRPFGSQLKHMISECQSWFNKTQRKTALDSSKPESTYERRSRFDALELLLKEHYGNPKTDVKGTPDEIKDYKELLKERKQLLNEIGRKK